MECRLVRARYRRALVDKDWGGGARGGAGGGKVGAQETRVERARSNRSNRRNRRPLKHLSPAAERQQGDRRRARVGLILVVVVFLVAGMVLYARLADLRAATTPVAAARLGR